MAQYSAIAESVQSMDTINFLRVHAKKLRFLNLHGNNIRTISNLDDCFYLEELDLSSNKIVTISGLEACESLLRLNLSCNQIKVAASLDFLYKLKHLNLSYNKLTQVKTLDRGALQNEIKGLRKELSEKVEELQDLTDKSRIKEHQLNDAMDTITKLKQTIVHNQQELNEITKLEQRIAGISQEKEDAETRVEALRQALNSCQEEREEILQKFEDVTEEGDLLKRKYKDLKQQWQEKIDILNTVEKATEEMSLRHLEQEKKWRNNVEEENEKILQLEQQIGAMKENHEVELRQQKVDADKRLQESVSREDSYKEQITGLEREMRLIIHQSQQLKKENEAKLTKLAGALGEFTTLLQPK